MGSFNKWTKITPGEGSTTIAEPLDGERIIIKSVLFMVTNPCKMYFHTGEGATLKQISPLMDFAAHGGWDRQNLDLFSTANLGLKVWFDTDPGCDMWIEIQRARS